MASPPDVYTIGHVESQQLWAHHILHDLRIETFGGWETVRAMPWSSVCRIPTSQGYIILKSMAKPFSNEAKILTRLNRHAPSFTTTLIAADDDLQCFMMHDAGVPLRDVPFNLHTYVDALIQCASVQIVMMPHVCELIQCGNNDWRLESLPLLYKQFFHEKKQVLIKDGMRPEKLAFLTGQHRFINQLCVELTNLGISETLEHGDFHDNNILVQADKTVISDWGDASITHPFFSCISFIESARRHHHIDRFIEKAMVEAYLAQWLGYVSIDKLWLAYKHASILAPFIVALSHIRFYECKNINDFPEFKGFATKALDRLDLMLANHSSKL